MDLTKLTYPSAVDVANPIRPSSPSPLTSSLSSTPVVTCFDASAAPPQSLVDDDDEIFYDAFDNLPGIAEPHFHGPVRTQLLRTLSDPTFDGVAKGRMSVGPRASVRPAVTRTTYTPPPPAFLTPLSRGSSKPTVLPATSSSFAPLALQAQLNFARLRASDYVPRREPTKKALVVGINYLDMGKEKRLWHAVNDAARIRQSLKNLGFQRDNIKLATDESGFEAPTYYTLMHSIDWLVRDAVDGDVLFFSFSGNCVKDHGLLTSDKRFLSRDMLNHHLVMRIPSGCELHIIFDCASAAELVQLPYCIGRMGVDTPASTGGGLRRGRSAIVERDHAPDHFEEQKGYFIQPAGRVVVWAGAGEGQQALEASGTVKHGIITNAMCSALDTRATTNNMFTRRDIWRSLVGAIDKENTRRSKRDAKKSLSDRQGSKLHVQHAELWVSQAEPLSSAALVLDQPILKL